MVTGHTGFKGSWMSKILMDLGSNVVGYSLNPPTDPNLYSILNLGSKTDSVIADVRDYDTLLNTLEQYKPEIVIHMAAQPLVGESYRSPRETYEVNVQGTVNILEAIRKTDCVKSFLNVTTDKVYLNREWCWGYREDEELNGYDPYSNSKSCSDLVTQCYSRCFFDKKIPISTARAGNVIGGGDFTNPRIIPDCMRAALSKGTVVLRNPGSTRPYQHVLEPVFAYLMIAAKQYEDYAYAGNYNVGPNEESCVDNETLVKIFCEKWGPEVKYRIDSDPNAPHEANFLKLDISKIKQTFGWTPIWDIDMAVEKTVDWIKAYSEGRDIDAIMSEQISEYMQRISW